MKFPHCGKTIDREGLVGHYIDFEEMADHLGFESEYEMLWNLRMHQGKPHHEIAEYLGVALSTVRRRLKREQNTIHAPSTPTGWSNSLHTLASRWRNARASSKGRRTTHAIHKAKARFGRI